MNTNAARRGAAYRALFRPQLDDEVASDIRKALRLGQKRNTGRRGRVAGEMSLTPLVGKQESALAGRRVEGLPGGDE